MQEQSSAGLIAAEGDMFVFASRPVASVLLMLNIAGLKGWFPFRKSERISMFAVVVTFMVKPEHVAAFMPEMLANAATSLRDEQGCHRFDVCTDPARPNEVFLYELYTDSAAFDVHLASTHFKAFDQSVTPMIASKDVRTYQTVHP